MGVLARVPPAAGLAACYASALNHMNPENGLKCARHAATAQAVCESQRDGHLQGQCAARQYPYTHK